MTGNTELKQVCLLLFKVRNGLLEQGKRHRKSVNLGVLKDNSVSLVCDKVDDLVSIHTRLVLC